jgi:hypothetical protein
MLVLFCWIATHMAHILSLGVDEKDGGGGGGGGTRLSGSIDGSNFVSD